MATVINARAQAFRHRDPDDLHSSAMSWTELNSSRWSEPETLARARSDSTVRADGLVMLPSALDPLGRTIRRVTTAVVDRNEQLLLVKRRASAAKATALRGERPSPSLNAATASHPRRSTCTAPRAHDGVSVTCADFAFVKALGVGAWGTVVLVRARRDNELYAMKVVSKRAVREHHLADKILSERDVLGGTHHHSLGS